MAALADDQALGLYLLDGLLNTGGHFLHLAVVANKHAEVSRLGSR